MQSLSVSRVDLISFIFFFLIILATYPEVFRIHSEYFTVILAQTGVNPHDVVHVLHCYVQTPHHHLAMGDHLGITHYCIGTGQFSKSAEIPLGPGVDDQDSDNERKIIFKLLPVHVQTSGKQTSFWTKWSDKEKLLFF